MNQAHPYADGSPLERLFDVAPSAASYAPPFIDECGETRQMLIDAHVLVPLDAIAARRQHERAAVVAIDTATSHQAAREQIKSFGVTKAREIADCPETDPRLATALRTLLSLPEGANQILARKGRR